MADLSDIITPNNVLTATSTNTVTNKTINASNNTVTNVSLTTAVTGTLPVANGGTGTTSTTFANLTTNVTGTLPVANGGTGLATLTANNVVLGNGTSTVNFVAPGSNGNVLTSNGTTWTSAAAPSSIASAGGVGAYALMAIFSTPAANLGDSIAASRLVYAGGFTSTQIWATSVTGFQPTGTWRLMGGAGPSGGTDSTYYYAIFLRIA
jgi:hypothetical protein